MQVRVYAMSPGGTWNFAWKVDPFAFAFADPTSGPPTVNVVGADSPTPTWFTLGGNQGLSIFAHAPSWKQVQCWSGAAEHRIPRSFDPKLTYDPITDRYEYVASHLPSVDASIHRWVGENREIPLPLALAWRHP